MNRMREIRKSRQMTMKELGKAVGVAESTISLYETGKHDPDLLTVGRIADELDVSVDALLGREENEKDLPTGEALDNKLIEMLTSLTPDQVQRVMDFVAGMKATGKV